MKVTLINPPRTEQPFNGIDGLVLHPKIAIFPRKMSEDLLLIIPNKKLFSFLPRICE